MKLGVFKLDFLSPLNVKSARDEVMMGESFAIVFLDTLASLPPLSEQPLVLKLDSLVERFLFCVSVSKWPSVSGGGGGIRIVGEVKLFLIIILHDELWDDESA
jgi:hypothetical protein